MKMTRRDFLKTAAALGAVALTPDASALVPTNCRYRIVRVHSPLASWFDVVNYEYQAAVPETYYGNFLNGPAVQEMFDAAVCTANWGTRSDYGDASAHPLSARRAGFH